MQPFIPTVAFNHEIIYKIFKNENTIRFDINYKEWAVAIQRRLDGVSRLQSADSGVAAALYCFNFALESPFPVTRNDAPYVPMST